VVQQALHGDTLSEGGEVTLKHREWREVREYDAGQFGLWEGKQAVLVFEPFPHQGDPWRVVLLGSCRYAMAMMSPLFVDDLVRG